MTTVGFIGSGRIGGTVARLAIAAGYNVVLSNSRVPQNLKDLVEELGPQARPATPAGAAAAGDLVVVSIPPRAYPAVPVEPLAGKPVLDTITTHVVEVFSNITFWHLASLARAAGAADRSALPIAGDDPTAKAAVTGFLRTLSGDTVDAGTLGSGGPPFPVQYPRVRHAVRHVQRPAGSPCGHTAILAALDAWRPTIR